MSFGSASSIGCPSGASTWTRADRTSAPSPSEIGRRPPPTPRFTTRSSSERTTNRGVSTSASIRYSPLKTRCREIASAGKATLREPGMRSSSSQRSRSSFSADTSASSLPTHDRSKQEAGTAVVRVAKTSIRNIWERSLPTGSLAAERAFHPVCDGVRAKPIAVHGAACVRTAGLSLLFHAPRERARTPLAWAASNLDERAGTVWGPADRKPKGMLRRVSSVRSRGTVPKSLAKGVPQTPRVGTRSARGRLCGFARQRRSPWPQAHESASRSGRPRGTVRRTNEPATVSPGAVRRVSASEAHADPGGLSPRVQPFRSQPCRVLLGVGPAAR
jgi:hypothetical protein